VIVVAIGIVVESLLRLRRWLNNAPPGHDIKPPPGDGPA